MILSGDCQEVLKTLPDNSVDSLVTDPPAGISFMGKDWDKDKGGRDAWVKWMTEVMSECLRVMKPGAHGLVWAIPRTSHWMAWALEDAGFEVRDVVTHLFGSGFPKSHDVAKNIDKTLGAKREVIGTKQEHNIKGSGENSRLQTSGGKREAITLNITAPATDAAKQWAGFGTALKPASEHWILIRKPCSEKTVAANVLKWGTGAINVDASRVSAGADLKPVLSGAKGAKQSEFGSGTVYGNSEKYTSHVSPQGRFPANLILSHADHCTDSQCDIECAVREMDEQSWPSWSNGVGASRFFYVAKASKRDKNAGLEGMEKVIRSDADGLKMSDPRMDKPQQRIGNENHHPTVKSTALMTYLIRMVTPPGGVVLDPFMGSGSTGVAARDLGFQFLGIEKDPDYFEIAKRRIAETT